MILAFAGQLRYRGFVYTVEMQIATPTIPPVIVNVMTPEKAFYTDWEFWLALGTSALAALTGWLALETRKLRQDSARSIAASEQAASAALQNVGIAQSAIQNRRAWVTVHKLEMIRHSSMNAPVNARVFLINSGQTPAFELQISSACRFVDKDSDIDKAWFEWEDAGAPRRLPLGPNVDVDAFQPFNYKTNEELNSVVSGAWHLYWYGIVKYKTHQDDACWSKWCYRYDRDNQKFEPVSFHNEAI